MITVPQATEKIIKRSRYLTEALSKDLINASSLVRYIRPDVESMVFRQVTQSSIMMALNRLTKEFKKERTSSPLFEDAPDMIVRSNLAIFYVKNSPTLLSSIVAVEEKSAQVQKKALFTFGRAETIILANKITSQVIKDILSKELISKQYENVSAITIHTPEMSMQTPGVLNLFIKSLAWEGINVLAVLTTETEITFVLENKDSNVAFSIFQGLFKLE